VVFSSFFFFKKSLRNSNKIPAKGIAKIAPKIPKSFAPMAKEIKTKTGGRPTNFLVKAGVTMFP